jgi:sulfhydrogenase subunit beta (sulfur reductase)
MEQVLHRRRIGEQKLKHDHQPDGESNGHDGRQTFGDCRNCKADRGKKHVPRREPLGKDAKSKRQGGGDGPNEHTNQAVGRVSLFKLQNDLSCAARPCAIVSPFLPIMRNLQSVGSISHRSYDNYILVDMRMSENKNQTAIIARQQLQDLIDLLRRRGYCVVGPTLRDSAIVYDEVTGLGDLPAGWTDHQDAGSYRLSRRDDEALFGYAVGPHSWKKFLLPERLRLWRARRDSNGINVIEDTEAVPKFALLGARSCELHAIAIQDKVFLTNDYQDADYSLRRENTFIVAVNCGQAGGTCFCVSMETGPQATSGFDLALTEILDDGPHRFLIEAGSEQGGELLQEITHEEAGEIDHAAANAAVETARSQMGRSMNTTGIKELLQSNPDHARWDDLASRCLSCANCTMVCPTCFCTTVEDVTDLSGEHAERWRRWDSCFTLDFSNIHGGSVRNSSKSRYRQWMTHKLASWMDQFGSSGCVGCGRCITWCPVGIDITEEVTAIRADGVAPKRADDTASKRADGIVATSAEGVAAGRADKHPQEGLK